MRHDWLDAASRVWLGLAGRMSKNVQALDAYLWHTFLGRRSTEMIAKAKTLGPNLAAVAGMVLLISATSWAADVPIMDPSRLELDNASVESVIYHGKQAIKMTEKAQGPGQAFAGLKGIQFHDGTIELEVSGAPSKTADPAARGFIGVAFRIQSDGKHHEEFYLRPSNGRAEDQEQRNHSVQYVSSPDWPWMRLRQETPGRYESYVDLQPGEWTQMRVVVRGKDARLFVGDATQPCLIVHDLKLGDVEGGVALWTGPGTEGYFRNVRITSASAAK
jgi:hypothetical protein